MFTPVKRPTSAEISTAVVATASLRLSAAVAAMATEWMLRLMERLYSAI